jgi:hypothetical protein
MPVSGVTSSVVYYFNSFRLAIGAWRGKYFSIIRIFMGAVKTENL